MNSLQEIIDNIDFGSGHTSIYLCLTSLLMSFVLGQFSAWIYIYTHQGLSYSRAFVQSIVLLTVIVTQAMLVIGDNIVVAFGLIGALSVIRFRNILKDTRDTAFIFFALITGMAIGTTNYQLAILGTILFTSVLLYLYWTSFGSRHTGDGYLRFHVQTGIDGVAEVDSLLQAYTRSSQIVSQRYGEAERGDISYRLIMRDVKRGDEFITQLQAIAGISQVTFVTHDEQAEV